MCATDQQTPEIASSADPPKLVLPPLQFCRFDASRNA
jgi:hypothetical protein